MSKWPSLLGALVFTFSVHSAVSSSTVPELKVGKSTGIRFPEDVRVGNTWLQSGLYRVRCDHRSAESHEMVFTRMVATNPYYAGAPRVTVQIVRAQCHVHPLYLKNKQTAVYIDKQSGGPTVTKIVIRGENVEHRFDR